MSDDLIRRDDAVRCVTAMIEHTGAVQGDGGLWSALAGVGVAIEQIEPARSTFNDADNQREEGK